MNQQELAQLRDHYDNTDQSDAIERAHWDDEIDPDPMVTTSLRLPKSLLDWVRAQAEHERIKPTALIRRWIEDRHTGADSLGARIDRLEEAVFHHRVEQAFFHPDESQPTPAAPSQPSPPVTTSPRPPAD